VNTIHQWIQIQQTTHNTTMYIRYSNETNISWLVRNVIQIIPYYKRGIALLFLDHDTGSGWGQRHATAAAYCGKDKVNLVHGGWMGPRAGLDRGGKSHPPPGFDPRTVQLVASRYTERALRPAEWHIRRRLSLLWDERNPSSLTMNSHVFAVHNLRT